MAPFCYFQLQTTYANVEQAKGKTLPLAFNIKDQQACVVLPSFTTLINKQLTQIP